MVVAVGSGCSLTNTLYPADSSVSLSFFGRSVDRSLACLHLHLRMGFIINGGISCFHCFKDCRIPYAMGYPSIDFSSYMYSIFSLSSSNTLQAPALFSLSPISITSHSILFTNSTSNLSHHPSIHSQILSFFLRND